LFHSAFPHDLDTDGISDMPAQAQQKTPLVSLALERKMITKEQFDKCNGLLRKARRIGLDTNIEELLTKQGFLTEDQIQELRHIVELGDGGTVFGSYRLGEMIGEGGMGKVYRAVHEVMNRTVALKVISYVHTKDKTGAMRFFQEIRALAKMRHPNVVTIFDCGRVGRRYFYAMECIEGNSLQQVVERQGMLSEEHALQMMRAIADALAHAHASSVIHRDVKPDNILIDEREVPKLTDFGLVMHHDADHMTLTQEGLMVGSYYYVSPEQIDGARDIDGRTDIYSLGATFYYALTGRTAYTGDTPQELISQTLAGNLIPPNRYCPQLSPRASNLIRRMMARNRDKRVASMEQVVSEIDAILRPPRWKRILRNLAAGAGLLGGGVLLERFLGVFDWFF